MQMGKPTWNINVLFGRIAYWYCIVFTDYIIKEPLEV